MEGLKKGRKIVRTPPLSEWIGEELVDTSIAHSVHSEAYLEELSRPFCSILLLERVDSCCNSLSDMHYIVSLVSCIVADTQGSVPLPSTTLPARLAWSVIHICFVSDGLLLL